MYDRNEIKEIIDEAVFEEKYSIGHKDSDEWDAVERLKVRLYDSFGIYLPLVVVNCIILGRALSYASKNDVGCSIKDALRNGISYTIAISIFGLLRELLGNGTITIMDNISSITGYREIIHVFNFSPNKLFLTSGGAFILLGILISIINCIVRSDKK